MILEQSNNFCEYIKNNHTYGEDCRVSYIFDGMKYKHDSWGDIRLIIIPVHITFKKLNELGYYNLLLKPKKNEISWELRRGCNYKYPIKCLKVFEQFGLKVIYNP